MLLAKASAHSTKEMRLHGHIMGVNSYANRSVGFSNIKSLKNRVLSDTRQPEVDFLLPWAARSGSNS